MKGSNRLRIETLRIDAYTAMMPEVFRQDGYVFFFYSNEGSEPMHIHVRRGGGFAKFWIEPLELDHAHGMKTAELARAEELVAQHVDDIRRKWNEVFGA